MPADTHHRASVRTILIALAALIPAGLLVDHCSERRGRPAELANASRIWIDVTASADGDRADDDSDAAEARARLPRAFWAIKDFDLSDAQIREGSQSARLLVVGDPEVLVYWNGILVHGERYWVGKPVSAINVGPLLERRNRVVLEARSDHGAGGLLAALWLALPGQGQSGAVGAGLKESEKDGAPTRGNSPIWVTDNSWRIATTADSYLLAGLVALESAPNLYKPKVWPKLDLGRWRPLAIGAQPVPLSWPSQRLGRVYPAKVQGYDGAEFMVGKTEPWPSGTLVEFNPPTEGCLAVSGKSLYTRRVFFLANASDLQSIRGPLEFALENGEAPSAVGPRVVPLVGATQWLDTQPEKISTVLLEGIRSKELAAQGSVWVQPCTSGSGVPSAQEPVVPKRLRWKQL